ncbi:uncharacterized protein GGS22DRAFT_184217 [Annulohypoxylon maeteangense]|uniref:uncharacterized protein n=1 Tax=Annulohypoxylon maeteangense TaxID=1927788 RepID=UPI002008E491|nr:uncharacterized protein GGS22DRAFT_184217 [Annulohypoxylon maeteangense]KAI0888638.1 hypothetical protein GGS22DRAFT_184217 [Annulohypoxylon maeteangense]
MCQYRKVLYQCNHSTTSPSPQELCQEQKDYESGQRSEACTIVETHARINVRIPQLCDACHERKETTDRQFQSIKERLGIMKDLLKAKHDLCKEHLDEAGVDSEEGEPSISPSSIESCIDGLTSLEEFLKMKMEEEHAHMMMLWDYR